MLNRTIFWQTSIDTKKKGFYIKNKNKYNKGRHQKEIFRKFNFLPLASKYLLSVLSMVVEKLEKCQQFQMYKIQVMLSCAEYSTSHAVMC
jgi:hypothetical protein